MVITLNAKHLNDEATREIIWERLLITYAANIQQLSVSERPIIQILHAAIIVTILA